MTDQGKSAEASCHDRERRMPNGWYWCRSCGSQHAHISYTDSDSGRAASKFVPLSPIPPAGQSTSEATAFNRDGLGRGDGVRSASPRSTDVAAPVTLMQRLRRVTAARAVHVIARDPNIVSLGSNCFAPTSSSCREVADSSYGTGRRMRTTPAPNIVTVPATDADDNLGNSAGLELPVGVAGPAGALDERRGLRPRPPRPPRARRGRPAARRPGGPTSMAFTQARIADAGAASVALHAKHGFARRRGARGGPQVRALARRDAHAAPAPRLRLVHCEMGRHRLG